MSLGSLVELAGLGLVLLGVAMVWLPLGLIFAGVTLVVAAQFTADREEAGSRR